MSAIMGSENDAGLETEPLMVDIAVRDVQGEDALSGDVELPASTTSTGKDPLTSPLDAAKTSDHEAKPNTSNTDWFKMGCMLWLGLIVFVIGVVITLETAFVTMEIGLFLASTAFVPVSIAYMFSLHQRLDRNQYPQLTNLLIWRLIKNDKICYSVLGFCFFTSIITQFVFHNPRFGGPYIYDTIMVVFSVCKGVVLVLFGSRKSYLLLMRWQAMKQGQSKNLELGKVVLVAFPAVCDWMCSFDSRTGYGSLSLSGTVINAALIIFFLAAIIHFVYWVRTQNIHVLYSELKEQVFMALNKAGNSGLVRRGRIFLASSLATAAATAAVPAASQTVVGASTPASSARSDVV